MTQTPPESKERSVAVSIATRASDVERQALLAWSVQLLAIRDSSSSGVLKARDALQLTAKSAVIWPILKLIGAEVKRLGWDDRGTKSRFGIVGVAIGVAAFGGQGAGIAALGTAVGVPLWVVLGAGSTFVGMMVEELQKLGASPEKPPQRSASTDVIDVEAVRKE